MNSQSDYDEVVMDAVDDANAPDASADVSTDTSQEASETAGDTTETQTEATPGQADETAQEGAQGSINDEFAKKWGIPTTGVTGRENRIPYSRVKKIVEKAQRDERDKLTKEFEGTWTKEKLQPVEAKVQDYEGRLQRVAQFEQVMESRPQEFLGMLAQLPAYKPFFDWIQQLQGSGGAQLGQPSQQPKQAYLDHSGMPQPDQTLSDGSKVYSLDGLAQRDEWLARQVEEKAVKQAEARMAERYAPLEERYRQQAHYEQMVPQVESQIAAARKWDKFADVEPRVIELLKTDRQLTLEGAYVRAYQEFVGKERERLTSDRNTVRSEVLAEMKRRPISTSAPVSTVRANTEQEPQSMDQVIREKLRERGLVR